MKLPLTHFNYFGWGSSRCAEVPEESESHVWKWLSQAVNLLDQRTDGPQVVVGYSMGGYLALALAVLRPQRVRGIIGIAPGFGRDLSENIYRLYGRHSVSLSADQKLFDFTLMDDGSLPILGQVDVRCPLRLGHSLGDETVSPKNPLLVSQAVTSKDVTVFLSKYGSHQFDSPQETGWLEHQLKTLCRSP